MEDVNDQYTLADDNGLPWLQPDYPGNASSPVCASGCAGLTKTVTIEAAQPYSTYGDYQLYPFDRHTVIFRFAISDATLNCTGAAVSYTPEQLNQLVLPRSGEWSLGSPAVEASRSLPIPDASVPILAFTTLPPHPDT